MSTPDYPKQNEDFVASLVALCTKDRGHRAALRRWWSVGTRHYAYPILGRLFALDDERKTLVSALYAVHSKDSVPAHVSGGNSIGSAALKLAGGSTSANGFDSMEKHFRRLLAADDFEDLGQQLFRLVKRMERASPAISLDYALLLKELNFWSSSKKPELRDKVKTDWALAFWQAPAEQPTAADA
ncbi:MAG: type I-E CRISPR-associated protein Cse2/CasB [Luteolibacter sp.]